MAAWQFAHLYANKFFGFCPLEMFRGIVNAETFGHSKEYFFYITLGIPFYMFGQALNPIIRADGSPRFAMASTLAGAVINMILDPLFIFVFQWGMMVFACVNKACFIFLQAMGKA